MKKVIIPLAPGFEEIEALTVVDILRRAGAEVTLSGTVPGVITGRNGIHVTPDAALDAAIGNDYDMVVLPGGAIGTENLKKDGRVKELITRMNAQGRLVTAICAAPAVLSAAGLIRDRTVTSHPGVRTELKAAAISDERVVTDGNIITSQGPGTAMEFAFRLVEALYGQEKVKEVNQGVLARL
ncbi:MAG: DJ-1/PfpI family protein [Deltaproteobacteria bacterium]|nr:DJ-1/PfpI family protein [Deltaproteobacteria bacterium]